MILYRGHPFEILSHAIVPGLSDITAKWILDGEFKDLSPDQYIFYEADYDTDNRKYRFKYDGAPNNDGAPSIGDYQIIELKMKARFGC